MITNCCCCPAGTPRVCVTVTCYGTPSGLGGVTVSVSGPGGYTASGTTDASGRYCTPDTDSLSTGTYTVTASKAGHPTRSATVVVRPECHDYSTSICLCNQRLVVYVAGCNSRGVEGATVTVSQGGSPGATGTTDASGNAEFVVDPTLGAVTVTATKTRFADGTATVAAGLLRVCSTRYVTVHLTPASGYHCSSCFSCADPVSDTLHLTDSALGVTATLSYDPHPDVAGWVGTAAYDYPGCFGPYGEVICAPKSTTVKFSFCVLNPTGSGVRHATSWMIHTGPVDPIDDGILACCPDNDAWGCTARMLDAATSFSGTYPGAAPAYSACPPSLVWFATLAENFNSGGVSVYGADGMAHTYNLTGSPPFTTTPACWGHSTTWLVTE